MALLLNRRLEAFVLLFFILTAGGVLLRQGSDRLLAVEAWSAEIMVAAEAAGQRDPALLAALVYAESRGQADALSVAGARGLCQLLPATATEMAARHGVAGSPWEPTNNLRLGAHYLGEQLDRFQGDEDLALLAYRLGPSAVSKAIQVAGSPDAYKEELRKRKPSPWEYRTQILRFRDRFAERAQAGIGLGVVERQEPRRATW